MKKLSKILLSANTSFVFASSLVGCSTSKESIYENEIHLQMPDEGMMNDIQGAFYNDGKWHLYFLYNSDARFDSDGVNVGGNGTDWYHATTTDWINWNYEGVAIHKYQTKWGDVASGTIIKDSNNDFGKGEDAIIAFATGYSELGQNTMAYYSLDGGYTFELVKNDPVIENPKNKLSEPDFRDPFVFKQDDTYYMYMAENDKFGIYSSKKPFEGYEHKQDLKMNFPTLECPTLLQMKLEDGSEEVKTVLFYSGNGGASETTGTYYSVGELNNGIFEPDTLNNSKRLDFGPDFYGSKFWYDSNGPQNKILGSAWMSNWSYSTKVPNYGKIGNMSLVREYHLKKDSKNEYYIESDFLAFESENDKEPTFFEGQNINFEAPNQKSFYMNISLPEITKQSDKFNISIENDGYKTVFEFNPKSNKAIVSREAESFNTNPTFNKKRQLPLSISSDQLNEGLLFEIYVDSTTIEVKINNEIDFSMLKFPKSTQSTNVKISSDSQLSGSYLFSTNI